MQGRIPFIECDVTACLAQNPCHSAGIIGKALALADLDQDGGRLEKLREKR
ncbi:MAG: hypothetical protein P8P56_13915 [Yoonia sp.]|nr:hypothetical protein [Yoonia sp.]